MAGRNVHLDFARLQAGDALLGDLRPLRVCFAG